MRRSRRANDTHRASNHAFAAPAVVAVAFALVTTAGVAAQSETAAAPAAGPLQLEGLEIEPAQPGPDTLCRLRLRLRNAAERDASALAFDVRLNGQELAVYRNQLFMQQIPAGATETVALYNFWTTETSRPAPADGKLRVEVTLREARWFAIGDEEGVEVWRPLDPVPGLPVHVERTVELASGTAR